MSEVSEVVSVTITRDSRGITQAAFDTPLYLGLINFFTERTRTYTSTTAMEQDGFPTNHPAYQFATKLFSQPQRPNRLIVGRQDYTAYTATPTVADSATYTLSVGVEDTTQEISITSDSSATATEIVDALVTAIGGVSGFTGRITATNVSDVLTITPATGEEVFVSATTSNLAIAQTGLETIATSIAEVENAAPGFFFLAAQAKDSASIQALSAWALANDKMYVAAVDAVTVGDNSNTSDIASTLRTSTQTNTITLARTATNLLTQDEGSVIGSIAAANPGTTTLFAKTLQGTAVDVLTATQRSTIISKNSNYYDTRGGSGFLFDGRTQDGSFADIIRFSLWVKARTAEAIFGLLKRKSDLGLKVPQSDIGDEMIRQAIFNDMINIGINRGAILTAADGATDPIVRIPDRSTRSTNDLANRILRDVEIELTYSGAVQNVIVRAFVSI